MKLATKFVNLKPDNFDNTQLSPPWKPQANALRRVCVCVCVCMYVCVCGVRLSR